MVQYYTLEQAAHMLRTTPEKLKEMAKRGEVRAFQDRGTLRFRSQEIDELVRLKGLGSDPELQLGEALAPPGPATGKQTSYAPPDHGAADASEAAIGEEPVAKAGSSSKLGKSPRPRTPSPKSPSPKSPTPKSPPPKASSDSDVRLVMDGSDLNFQLAAESDVPVGKAPAAPPPSGSQKGKTEAKPDSGVRIVPLDKTSDSDVKIVPDESDVALGGPKAKTPSDSDIRLEPHTPAARSGGKPGSDPALVTEEIDLDAEARKAEESARAKKKSKVRTKDKAPDKASPFELSDSDLNVKAASAAKEGATPPVEKKGETDSSSDFELTPVGDSPLELGSDEVPIISREEEVSLGEHRAKAGDSGINLQDPADSGVSLEKGSGEVEFELSREAGSTPKPGPLHVETESSDSEFELSSDAAGVESDKPDSSSEFELSLDAAEGQPKSDSDSEFELTLDDSGGLAAVEGGSPVEPEKDIFETDFEVPALGEDSGSEAVALDEGTDLESSDFDIEMSDESGSQVVSLEDEPEADESVETMAARPRRGAALVDESGEAVATEGLEEGEAEEELAEGRVPVGAAPAPAEWGALPGVVLLIAFVPLFIVTLMGWEMLQAQHGYHKPGLITGTFAKMFDDSLPKD
jgi:hypothetical protein